MLRLRKVFSREWTCLLVVLLLTLGMAGAASAQGERGVIGGTVSDAQGGVRVFKVVSFFLLRATRGRIGARSARASSCRDRWTRPLSSR